MEEKENVLKILEQTKEAVKKEDVVKLKELSNQTIHTASTTQDPDNIAVAVIVYSLGKVIERKEYLKQDKYPEFCRTYVSAIDRAILALKKNDEKKFKDSLELIRKAINKLSGNLKKYIQDVFRKASINKASKIYEHGISMEKTASLLGITMFELASYAGQTGVSDAPLGKTLGVKERIKLAMGMFK